MEIVKKEDMKDEKDVEINADSIINQIFERTGKGSRIGRGKIFRFPNGTIMLFDYSKFYPDPGVSWHGLKLSDIRSFPIEKVYIVLACGSLQSTFVIPARELNVDNLKNIGGELKLHVDENGIIKETGQDISIYKMQFEVFKSEKSLAGLLIEKIILCMNKAKEEKDVEKKVKIAKDSLSSKENKLDSLKKEMSLLENQISIEKGLLGDDEISLERYRKERQGSAKEAHDILDKIIESGDSSIIDILKKLK